MEAVVSERVEEEMVFESPEERNFAVMIQSVWWAWEEGLLTTSERISHLKRLELQECSRVFGSKQKEILVQSIRLVRSPFVGVRTN